MSSREGYLHDYLAASFIGVTFGMVIAAPAGAVLGDWGRFIGAIVVAGLFGFIPGGLLSGYINFRFHHMGENLEMSGLSAGFFTALVYAIVDLIITLVYAIMGANAGNVFIGWVISVIFGFLFFTLGGYLSGMLEKRPFAMPSIFNLSNIRRGAAAPPPPPGTTTMTCQSCGSPLRYIQQYQRWYCDKEQKYA
jgi:MFS family permease